VPKPTTTASNVTSYLDWSESEHSLFARLGSGELGLTESSAMEKRHRAPRQIGVRHSTGLRLLLRQFSNPVTVILLCVSAVSTMLGELSQSLIVLAIVAISESIATRIAPGIRRDVSWQTPVAPART